MNRDPIKHRQFAKAMQRRQLLQKFHQLLNNGKTWAEAATAVGYSISTLSHWTQLWSLGGVKALTRPKRHFEGGTAVVKLGMTPATIRKVRQMIMEEGGRKQGWERFARSPQCPRHLAQIIRERGAGQLPHSLDEVVRMKRVKLIGWQSGNRLLIRAKGFKLVAID